MQDPREWTLDRIVDCRIVEISVNGQVDGSIMCNSCLRDWAEVAGFFLGIRDTG